MLRNVIEMKSLIRKILTENNNQKIIDKLKGKFNFKDFEGIKDYLDALGYSKKEISEIFGEWFKMETGLDWIDYYDAKKIILVGSKTNFLKHMLNKYDHIKGDREIYFFENGYHFGTLYKVGSFMQFQHDGSVDINGRRK